MSEKPILEKLAVLADAAAGTSSNAATITGRPLFFDSDCKNDMDICPPLVTM